MNPKQRIVILSALILLSLSELFPPWLYENVQASSQYSAGYHFIFSPYPEVKSKDEMKRIFSIPLDADEYRSSFVIKEDLGRRYGQRLALLFLTFGLLVFLMERKSYVKGIISGFLICIGIAFFIYVLHDSWFMHV
jgi:hypothetical protein